MTDFSEYKGIWVFCEQRNGELMSTDFELVSEARRLAGEIGCKVTGVVLGGEGMEAAAKELAPNGIRVNAVAPGLINTGLLQAIGENKIQENLKNVKMGRLGEPIDVANVLVFLASDLSGYVTGEIIGIDGEATV